MLKYAPPSSHIQTILDQHKYNPEALTKEMASLWGEIEAEDMISTLTLKLAAREIQLDALRCEAALRRLGEMGISHDH